MSKKRHPTEQVITKLQRHRIESLLLHSGRTEPLGLIQGL